MGRIMVYRLGNKLVTNQKMNRFNIKRFISNINEQFELEKKEKR